MDAQEKELQFRMARSAGRESSCGVKIRYSEEAAMKSAVALTQKHRRSGSDKTLEAYPCPFCGSWHIGRAMTDKEREWWSQGDRSFTLEFAIPDAWKKRIRKWTRIR